MHAQEEAHDDEGAKHEEEATEKGLLLLLRAQVLPKRRVSGQVCTWWVDG
jgi:hypothetical protein